MADFSNIVKKRLIANGFWKERTSMKEERNDLEIISEAIHKYKLPKPPRTYAVYLEQLDRAIEALRFELRERTGDFICGSRMDEEEATRVAQLILDLERIKRL